MDARTALKHAGELGGPFALAAGAAMLTVAVISTSGGDGGVNAAPAPAPTVTVSPSPRPVVTVAPAPPPPSATLVVDRRASAAAQTPRPDTPGAADSGRMGVEQTPPGTTSPPHCTGRILALQGRLAALPDCITLGGSR